MSHLHLVPDFPELSWTDDEPTTRRVEDLMTQAGRIIQGQYVLAGALQATATTQRLQLTLADATGSVLGFVWPEHRDAVHVPELGRAVQVSATVRAHEGRPQLAVSALRALQIDELVSATDLLVDLQHGELRDALHVFEMSLASASRRFLQRVLLDPAIGPKLLACRASRAHHHAGRSGLLMHSLENLDLIGAIVERTLPGDQDSVDIARLGYFLHDIGKIRTVGDERRPPLHHVIRHETHNWLVLAPHLAWLSEERADLHAGLTCVLEHVALPAAARQRPRYFPAEVVVQFDQWSAAAHSRRDLASLSRAGPRRMH